jgi:hypothetical protein
MKEIIMTLTEAFIQTEVQRINAAYRAGEIDNETRHRWIRNTLERWS